MKKRMQQHFNTPIVGRVVVLNKYILSKRSKAKKAIQYNYVDDLLKQCNLLFKYALRQLSGKDYIKRTVELCEEIQGGAYLIESLGGFTRIESARIDVIIDDILDDVMRMSKGSKMSELSHEA